MNDVDIIKKRFIAGAVCPECQELDRIVVETALFDGQEHSRRRCVSCGFADEFAEASLVNSQGVPRGKPERARNAQAATLDKPQAITIQPIAIQVNPKTDLKTPPQD